MADGDYDFAVLGSTPLAALLAGLLAAQHGRRVALVSDAPSPFQLQRGLDLSASVLTRPETLILLRSVTAETSKLLNELGKGLVDRIDPLFIAETPASAAALLHFRHLGRALGLTIDLQADRDLPNATMMKIRGVMRIAQTRLLPALEGWYERHDVRRLSRADTVVTVRRDGSARLAAGSFVVDAKTVILADDVAIIDHLTEETRDRSLVLVPTAATLLEPRKPLPAPVTAFLDRGVVVQQEGRFGVSAVVSGDQSTVHARLGASIARGGPVRRAGETVFTSVTTSDGAPLVTTAKGGKAMVLAGFGATGAFLAPAIARFVVDKSSTDEALWFAARGSLRGNQRLDAAEYQAATP
ncbi:hypothetical protein [Devosia sp.]|uniref:hypothetical protein n=1 Tax=Devosia sp. TaxID=1871048 RepID=UPI003BA921E4